MNKNRNKNTWGSNSQKNKNIVTQTLLVLIKKTSVFHYIFIDVIYSKIEVIDFSVFRIDKAWIWALVLKARQWT